MINNRVNGYISDLPSSSNSSTISADSIFAHFSSDFCKNNITINIFQPKKVLNYISQAIFSSIEGETRSPLARQISNKLQPSKHFLPLCRIRTPIDFERPGPTQYQQKYSHQNQPKSGTKSRLVFNKDCNRVLAV